METVHFNMNVFDDAYLSLLVTAQLEVLASLDGQHSLGSAVGLHTLQPQHNLLCSFSLDENTARPLPPTSQVRDSNRSDITRKLSLPSF